jgi:hypothetical protein
VFVDGERYEVKEEAQAAAQPGQPARPPVDVAGTWTLTINVPEGSMVLTARFQQSGAEVTGTVSEPQIGTADIRSGAVAGNALSFAASINVGGTLVDVEFSGTVEGNTMKGTANVPGFGPVDFTGSRPQTRRSLGDAGEGGHAHDLP